MLIELLEAGANRVLDLDPESRERLARFEGRVFGVDLAGVGVTLFLRPGADGLRVDRQADGTVDVWLRGSPMAFAAARLRGADVSSFTSGELEITGDVALGEAFARELAALDLDWEEPLASVIGDWPAHQIGNLARDLAGWAREAGESIARTAGEYLTEERELVASTAHVRSFLDDVDELRARAERLEQRVRRLEQRDA